MKNRFKFLVLNTFFVLAICCGNTTATNVAEEKSAISTSEIAKPVDTNQDQTIVANETIKNDVNNSSQLINQNKLPEYLTFCVIFFSLIIGYIICQKLKISKKSE